MKMAASILATLALLLFAAGCDHDSDRPKNGDDHPIRIPHVTEYRSSDPNLEPTMTLGKHFEIRTANGGPVVLASEVERQRKAAEEQRREQQAQRDAKP
jgi:hypothetical protein